MKRLFALVAMLGVFLLTPQSNASDLEKLYPEQLNAAKNLYQLTHAYFNGTGKLTEDNLLSPEMVKSRLRQAQFYHLWRLIALAVDAGYDLSDLQEFGIELNGPGFTIDLKKHPQWAKMSSLFRRLSNLEEFDYHAQKLKNLGLSDLDVQVLHQYITANNPDELELLAERQLVRQFVDDNKSLLQGQTYTTERALGLHESIRKAREFSWNTWGSELLNKFTLQSQRILLNYMHQKLGKLAIAPQPMQMQYLNTYAQELKSGQALADLNVWLTKYDNSSNKEVKQ